MSRDLEGTTTACGVRLSAKSLGIADPVLPCGAKVYIDYDDQSVLTQVIAVGPAPGGARFGLTPALAADPRHRPDRDRPLGLSRARVSRARPCA